jgi:predicted secreted protein
MSNAWWAHGSSFKVGDDGSVETFTKVAEVIDINGPSMSKDAIDVSNQDSTSGWREFVPGFRDGGEVSIIANWIPAHGTHDGTSGILSKFTDNVLHNFQIVTADDGSSGTMDIDFAGIVTNWNPTLPLLEQARVDFTVKVSGAVTIAAST